MLNKTINFLLFFVILFFISCEKEETASADPTDSTDTVEEVDPCAVDPVYVSFQSEIDAASDGDTVHVSSGTYYENLNFFSNNITLIGENSENTIIDGGGTGSVVTFNNVSGLVIDNFTITNGNNFNGGGIYSNFSSSKQTSNFLYKSSGDEILIPTKCSLI